MLDGSTSPEQNPSIVPKEVTTAKPDMSEFMTPAEKALGGGTQ